MSGVHIAGVSPATSLSAATSVVTARTVGASSVVRCLVWTLSAVHEPVMTRAAILPATSVSCAACSIAASTCSQTSTTVSHVFNDESST